MSKKEYFEAWMESRKGDINVKVDLEGLGWAGFWIGLGIVLAAQVIVTGKEFFK